MQTAGLGQWLREIGGAALVRAAECWSDAQLLESYLTGRQEAAFTAIVHRHGRMVWQVCRSVVQDSQAAEDAFQATFLILVRKGGAIRKPELLGNWLYGVAYRVAVRARSAAARRRWRESDGVEHLTARLDKDPGLGDVQKVVHEEMQRLPEHYRTLLVMCCLQGKTREEAARELDWPVGTVKGRMSRARDLLRSRLQRRGLQVPVAGLGAWLTCDAASAMPAGLWQSSVSAAMGTAAISAPVESLAHKELQVMLLSKVKRSAAVLIVLTMVVATGLWSWAAPPQDDPPGPEGLSAAGTAVAEVPQEKEPGPAEFMQSTRNLKNIGLAMHIYMDAMGTLPPAAIVNKDHKALLSWRVLLLPYLGERALFKEFNLREPWDSPTNKKLLAKMPKVYASCGIKTKEPHMTYYQVFHGPGAGFEGDQGLHLTDFSDGTSNTALVIEGGEPVLWTKPADLSYDPKKALPKLGGHFKDRIHVVLADGSVHAMRQNFAEKAMRTLIGRNDGEATNFGELELQKD
jgi:RNA polymerase sigma factor (sigma-70 family)